MRSRFDEQLAQLERELIEMGALCEESIALAAKSLGDGSLARQVAPLDTEIDRHLEKWNMKRSTYDSAVTELRNLIRERPSYVMTYIKETFGFTDAQMEDYFGESLKMIEAQSGSN